MQFNGPDKKESRKVVVTKICFYGSAKIEWKIKVCVMENKGSVAKMIKIKICRGNNILLEHKSIDCLDHFQYTCEQNVHVHMCVHVYIYMYIWTKAHTYMQKHENFYMYAYGHICCVYVNKCT